MKIFANKRKRGVFAFTDFLSFIPLLGLLAFQVYVTSANNSQQLTKSVNRAVAQKCFDVVDSNSCVEKILTLVNSHNPNSLCQEGVDKTIFGKELVVKISGSLISNVNCGSILGNCYQFYGCLNYNVAIPLELATGDLQDYLTSFEDTP